MILVISHGNCYGKAFYQYLSENGYSAINIDICELLKAQVYHSNIQQALYNKLILPSGESIYLSEIQAVYHNIELTCLNEFSHFHPKDQLYARYEWIAYLLYFSSSLRKIINPLSYKELGGSYLSMPYNYHVAQQCNFQIPKFYYNTSKEGLRDSLTDNCSAYALPNNPYLLAEPHEHPIFFVENPVGNPLVVHIIGQEGFASRIDGQKSEPVQLPSYILRQCLNIMSYLDLVVAEIVLFNYKNDYVFYSLFPYPDWKKSHLTIESLWQKLYFYLIN